MPGPDLLVILKSHLDCSLDMLARGIEQCSDRAWTDDRRHAPIWEQVYHGLFWFNAWLRDWSKPIEYPEYHVAEALEIKRRAGRAISRVQMRGYLAKVRADWEAFAAGLSSAALTDELEAFGRRWTVADRILGQVRHVQHHVGYLNAVLAQDGVARVRWIGVGES